GSGAGDRRGGGGCGEPRQCPRRAYPADLACPGPCHRQPPRRRHCGQGARQGRAPPGVEGAPGAVPRHLRLLRDRQRWPAGGHVPQGKPRAGVSFGPSRVRCPPGRSRGRPGDLAPPRKGTIGDARDRWILTLSRRLEAPGGAFAGVAVAVLSLDYLLDFYHALRLGDKGSVALFNGDGILVARSPLAESHMGRSYADSELISNYARQQGRGQLRTRSPVDDVARIYGFHRVEDADALVLVGLDEATVLAGWRQRMLFDGAIAGLAFLLFLAASLAALAWVRQRHAWERERTRRLRLLA